MLDRDGAQQHLVGPGLAAQLVAAQFGVEPGDAVDRVPHLVLDLALPALAPVLAAAADSELVQQALQSLAVEPVPGALLLVGQLGGDRPPHLREPLCQASGNC